MAFHSENPDSAVDKKITRLFSFLGEAASGERQEEIRKALPEHLEKQIESTGEERAFLILYATDETVFIYVSDSHKYYHAPYVVRDGAVEFRGLKETKFQWESLPLKSLSIQEQLRSMNTDVVTDESEEPHGVKTHT